MALWWDCWTKIRRRATLRSCAILNLVTKERLTVKIKISLKSLHSWWKPMQHGYRAHVNTHIRVQPTHAAIKKSPHIPDPHKGKPSTCWGLMNVQQSVGHFTCRRRSRSAKWSNKIRTIKERGTGFSFVSTDLRAKHCCPRSHHSCSDSSKQAMPRDWCHAA